MVVCLSSRKVAGFHGNMKFNSIVFTFLAYMRGGATMNLITIITALKSRSVYISVN